MKYKLGDFLEIVDIRNRGKYNADKVLGISTKKEFIPTKANLEGVNLNSYKCVPQYTFAYVADTSRRGDKISLAYNANLEIILVSSISTVFKVKENSNLLPDYLYMYFNRPEFDRYTRFNSWGSARETFTWGDMCDIEIELPSLQIQKKYVDVYKALSSNLEVYENGIEDLKTICDGTIENFKKKHKKRFIKNYIYEINKRNIDSKYPVLGVSKEKIFLSNSRHSKNTKNYKLVESGSFALRPVLDTMDSELTLALNRGDTCAVSPIYLVFSTDEQILLSEYLFMWLSRKETERWLAYNAWGSARNTVGIDELGEIEMPIPPLTIQKSLIDVLKVYEERKNIDEKLKQQIKDICPVLIKGSLEEVAKSEKV